MAVFFRYIGMMKVLGQIGLLLWLVFAMAAQCCAQHQTDTVYVPTDKEKGYDKKKRLFATYEINQLKHGLLFVMLHTRERTIKNYRDHNATEIADRLMTEQVLENRMIVKAFMNNFRFCPVYFFYDTEMDEVRKGKMDGIFLNGSLERDATIKPSPQMFMVADFSPLEEESFEFVQEGGHPSATQTNSGQRSLIMRDNYFVQMRAPFPYAVSARITANADRQVANLNSKLTKFYEKHKDANAVYPFVKK